MGNFYVYDTKVFIGASGILHASFDSLRHQFMPRKAAASAHPLQASDRGGGGGGGGGRRRNETFSIRLNPLSRLLQTTAPSGTSSAETHPGRSAAQR